ncbi:DUF5134 domain-containing protein [Streptomyces sp. NPDC086091]|uniref:DUF5134 domain-containing protein n=1 Tax=Streptomyces sp. NPDC086091 TaxID=3365751 RepID=UPI00381BD9F0
MHGPASPGWLLVALCAATGAYCLLRMRSSDAEQRRAAGDEALMGFGMAVMAVPAGVFTPPWWVWPGYVVLFGAAALRALWAARSGAHHLHHLVGAGAMAYLSVAMTVAAPASGHHHAGTTITGVPALTGVLLAYFAGYVIVAGVRLLPVAGVTGVTEAAGVSGVAGGPPVSVARGWGDRPELARVCRLSMGIGMLAMLLTM